MTGWGSRQLPISWPPLAGEALDSWLQSYAARLNTSTRSLLNHLGVASRLVGMVSILTDSEAETLAAAAGLSATAVKAMTLARFDGIAVTIDPQTRSLVHPPAWRRQTGSRFCPACLADTGGRWQLRWRLPWTFACTRHHCLLLDYCPACRHRPTPDRPFSLDQPLISGRCSEFATPAAPGRIHRNICGHLLADAPSAPLPSGGRIMAAQQHVDELIDAAGGPGGHIGPGDTLTEIYLLAFRSLLAWHASPDKAPAIVAEIVAEAGTITAVVGPLDTYDAVTVAAGTAIAVAAHAATGDDLIAWIVASTLTQLSTAEPGRLLRGYKNAGPALSARILTALDPHLRTMQRLAYGTAGPEPRRPDTSDQHLARRAASLPSQIWPTWALALIPASRTATNILTPLSADLAIMLMSTGTLLSCNAAATLLGQPGHRTNLDACLPADTAGRRTVLAAIAGLSTALDHTPAPIDYSRRRALFSNADIDRHDYSQLAASHGWKPASPLQHHLLDSHLRALLTGAPQPGRRDRRGDFWNPLTVALPAVVRAFVHDQARRHLRRHRLHEPLTWQPALPDQPGWPGITAADVDAKLFTTAFATHGMHRCAVRRISEATGLSATQIRLYARIADLEMREPQWAGLADWTIQPGDPHGLIDLHHQQHLPMIDIMRLGLASQGSVHTTFTQAGQPAISHHPSKKQLSKEWFNEHFIGTHKSCTQAAAELGISRNTFAKYARSHGIDTSFHTRTADPFAAWPAHRKPPADVTAACSTRNGVAYLRQLVTLLEQPNQRAAAATLGISEQTLFKRRRYIERATGIQICQPTTAPARPVELTSEGNAFLQQARNALHSLDRHQRS